MGIMTSMLTGSGTVTGEKADCTFSTQLEKPSEAVPLKDTARYCDPDEDIYELLGGDDQCWVENDGIGWVLNEPPKRKRVCEASPEKQAKYREMLKQIFSPVHALLGRRFPFHLNDLLEICVEVKPYLESEPVFIEDIEAPITIIGDLHGQLHDLYKTFCVHSVDGKPGYECGRFLFLGNYIERGHQSVEVFIALFLLKILYPSEFFLLRGEYEFAMKNRFNFKRELKERFSAKKTRHLLWVVFNGAFQWLSLCAIVGGKVFCAHGGISMNGFTRTSLRNLCKPILKFESYLVQDLVMSDPADGLRGTAFNVFRGSSILFGEDAFSLAMDAVDCNLMFRGHSRIVEGCEITWDRCFTLYAATDVSESMNKGSFAQLDKNLILKIIITPVDPIRHREWVKLKAGGFGKVKKEEDLGTGTITKFDG